jgi:hypothetical protein
MPLQDKPQIRWPQYPRPLSTFTFTSPLSLSTGAAICRLLRCQIMCVILCVRWQQRRGMLFSSHPSLSPPSLPSSPQAFWTFTFSPLIHFRLVAGKCAEWREWQRKGLGPRLSRSPTCLLHPFLLVSPPMRGIISKASSPNSARPSLKRPEWEAPLRASISPRR